MDFDVKYRGNTLVNFIKVFDAKNKSIGRADYDGMRRTIVFSTAWCISIFYLVTSYYYLCIVFIAGCNN